MSVEFWEAQRTPLDDVNAQKSRRSSYGWPSLPSTHYFVSFSNPNDDRQSLMVSSEGRLIDPQEGNRCHA